MFYLVINKVRELQERPEGLKALAMYFTLKRLFKTGVFYNYNPAKLTKLTNCSRYIVSRYVKKMIDYNLAHMHNGNLCLYSFREFKKNVDKHEKSLVYIRNYEYSTFQEALQEVKYAIFNYDIISPRKYFVDMRSDIVKSIKAVKKAIKKGYDISRIEKTDAIRVSYRTIARKMNMYQSQVRNFLEEAINDDILKEFMFEYESLDLKGYNLNYRDEIGNYIFSNSDGVNIHRGTILVPVTYC